MIYPIVVAVVALVVVIIMLVKVIPGYMDMFNDLGTELPKITQAVVAASDFIIAYWFINISINVDFLNMTEGFNNVGELPKSKQHL